jgi:ABC-type multidrug transport system ATPase subunit
MTTTTRNQRAVSFTGAGKSTAISLLLGPTEPSPDWLGSYAVLSYRRGAADI